MEFIKSWIFCVCSTLMLAVIFSVLTPKGSMGKFYKIIISMFIFASFLYPISNAKADDFKIDFPSFGNSYNMEFEESSKNNVELIVENALKEKGINSSVSAEIDLDNDEIIINEVVVYVPDSCSAEDVKSYLLEKIGLVVDVKYVGE